LLTILTDPLISNDFIGGRSDAEIMGSMSNAGHLRSKDSPDDSKDTKYVIAIFCVLYYIKVKYMLSRFFRLKL